MVFFMTPPGSWPDIAFQAESSLRKKEKFLSANKPYSSHRLSRVQALQHVARDPLLPSAM